MVKLRDILKERMSEEELKYVPTSFDIIGSAKKAVAIVDIKPEVEKKAEEIAWAIMKLHSNVKTVLQKLSERQMMYRLREFKIIAGEPDTEVLHKEHGFLIKVDPQRAYFSPRESTERQRVAEQTKAGERILVMFSGVCPYAIAIAKRQPKVKEIIAVDANPDAHKYAEENIRINKLGHKITAICGDVKDVCPGLGKFDRIIMPLAKDAWRYLDIAMSCLKKNGIVHFYAVAPEENLFGEPERFAKEMAKRLKIKIKVLKKKKVLPWGSRKWKVCLDIKKI
ncbi:MAG: class I SAM-dependent methyltransferase family protein [Candidatus Aenigmatarchaeota archaeon]